MTVYFWCLLGLLVACTFAFQRDRIAAFSRSREDWWIDGANLVIHLWGLPLLQAHLPQSYGNEYLPGAFRQLLLPVRKGAAGPIESSSTGSVPPSRARRKKIIGYGKTPSFPETSSR